MAGGAMGGYWDTGIWWMANAPTVMMIMAMTQAKTGRSRKNFESIRAPLRVLAVIRLVFFYGRNEKEIAPTSFKCHSSARRRPKTAAKGS